MIGSRYSRHGVRILEKGNNNNDVHLQVGWWNLELQGFRVLGRGGSVQSPNAKLGGGLGAGRDDGFCWALIGSLSLLVDVEPERLFSSTSNAL